MDGHSLIRLRRLDPSSLETERRRLDTEAETVAAAIIADVAQGKEEALRRWAGRTGELAAGDPLVIGREDMERAFLALDAGIQALLQRTARRVTDFARAQRNCLVDLDTALPGARAGHEVLPVSSAGCYVPGGRYPLPSSAIMTVCPARVAGVDTVWCAGPRPSPITLAAAFVAGADGFLAAGGAQAIAALAYGVASPACDLIVGPGGRYVAAAKRLLFGLVGTDAPAGPSELLILADSSADPALAAADLLAQAEHDVAALPAIVVEDEPMAQAVESGLERLLATLPPLNRETAAASLGSGWVAVVGCSGEAFKAFACGLADRFAPEHLELLVKEPAAWRKNLKNAGAVFEGSRSAEVMGDYGAGPNHCLPTSGAARFAAGLSVFTFLRARTWLAVSDPEELAADAAALARLEGLEAHARAAEARRS
jgi:phosphoribosyl-ATP pyrophosphohydrolase/phosphoribosyl-AMP cyclohydrolase/histidinol dehydrogenase